MLKYESSVRPPVRPKHIRFGLLSSDEIRRMAVVKVTDTTLYYRGLPNSGGLLDPLMGTVNRLHLCASCMRDATTCQGHCGYMELAWPMYGIGFIETVIKVLRTVCFACSRVCCTEEDLAVTADMPSKAKLTHLHSQLRSKKTCPHCGYTLPSYARSPLGVRVEWPADMAWECEEEKTFCTAPFTAREALSILTHIPDADCEALGFDPKVSHPKNMIHEVLVVPPPCTRPAIYASEQSRSRGQNDLTMKLLDCLKRSNELAAEVGCDWRDFDAPVTDEMLDRMARLQYDIFLLVSNNVRGYKPPSVRSAYMHKTLSDRLSGKEGRVRGNLLGKRVNFSARCVITPDAYFACDRVGVPYSIAKTLTVPETVNANNIMSLTKRVRAGSDAVHGAQGIIHKSGEVIDLAHCKDRNTIVLRIGDVVERNLDDDDMVIFNRQPSLHKHGMQAHRVRLMPGKTFRLSLVVASPYNADFDGDEMNLHVLQSTGARAEAALLLSVCQNIIGPQSNKPTMGIVQDSLLGMHKMTLPSTMFTHRQACRLVGVTMYVKRELPPPCLTIRNKRGTPPLRLWSGKQIFSTLLPHELCVGASKVDVETLAKDDSQVVVRNGHLLTGTIRKAHVGTAAGGIIDVITREYGGITCCRFFDDGQRMTHAYLLMFGHEVGIHDVMLSKEGHERVRERLEKATRLCDEIQKEIDADDVPPDVALSAESAILRLLSKTLMQSGSIVNEHMSESNSIRRMVNAGSKGSFINLSQICAALGQQSLEGARIRAEKGTRTLPCFAHGDKSLASQGFVCNSYALGLSPTELFFHAIGGREGLVDTSVKTSQTGYLQRRMNKSFEDHLTHEHGYIQNAMDEVVSFQWGSDGLHPAHLERVRLPILAEATARVRERMSEEEASIALRMREAVFRSKAHVLSTEIDTRVLLPFHPDRIRRFISRSGAASASARVDGATATREALALAEGQCNVLGLAVLDVCCHHSVRHMDTSKHAELMADLRRRIDAAQCPAGEAVGSLAAQSTGEPTTQMTLNSVDWNTTMVIHWTGTTPPPAPHDAEVGAFIDALIAERPADCQVQPDGNTIYLPLAPGTAAALSPDEDGRMVWTELEAVTRHPPINKDGSNTLVQVTTDSGRTVTVTKGKSLLVERGGKLVEVDGDAVKVGDRVPVVRELPPAEQQDTLDLHTVFRETEAVFTNTMIEAMEATKHHRHWFQEGGFKARSCYNRSDTMRDAVKKRPALLEPDKVVKPQGGNFFPAHIPLDRDFGFFVGAYLAEGCVTAHQVHISNVDSVYRNAARIWPERHGIHSHETKEEHQRKNNGTSISVMFHSTILVELMVRTCGKLSAGKRVPGFAFAAPNDFVRGLLDGYFSGDGCVSKKQAMITACSRSQKLRDGIALLLTRFGIGCRLSQYNVHSHVLWTTEEDGTRTQAGYGDKTPLYNLAINADETRRFAQQIDLVLAYKQDRCTAILDAPEPCKISKRYANMKDVCLEEIVALNEVPSSHPFVYDLTVAQTRNMTATNGLASRDTFHFAGVSAKNVTLGLPRLKELVDASKAPKTPCTTLRFKDPYARCREFSEYFANTLPLTRLSDIVTECDIVFDPDLECTTVEEDREMVELDHMLEADKHLIRPSRYVVRLKLHKEIMRTRLLTTPMVRGLLRDRMADRAHVSSTEANCIHSVVRLRFNQMQDMVDAGGLAVEDESIICHRAINALMDTVLISGHKDVQMTSTSESNRIVVDPERGTLKTVEEYVVHVYGTFLADAAASPLVDFERCTSNNVWETLMILGVEACAHVLFDQIKAVISFDGQYVDDRHLVLIVDSMCRNGKLMPLNRHGINRTEASPLMRASFEETIDVLCDAAVFAESENARGVTTSIMTGQLAEFGSGAADVLLHKSMLAPCNHAPVKIVDTQRVKVLRSRCRSYVHKPLDVQTFEYVPKDAVGVRPSHAPITVEEVKKPRCRFRPVSPPPEK